MKRMNERGRRTVLSSIAIGVAVALLISLTAGLMICLTLVNGGITEERIPYIIVIVHFVASVAGAFIAGKRTGEKYAIICTGASVCYCVILIASTVLLFESQFDRVGLGAGSCAAGSVVACLLCMINKRRSRKIK